MKFSEEELETIKYITEIEIEENEYTGTARKIRDSIVKKCDANLGQKVNSEESEK